MKKLIGYTAIAFALVLLAYLSGWLKVFAEYEGAHSAAGTWLGLLLLSVALGGFIRLVWERKSA